VGVRPVDRERQLAHLRRGRLAHLVAEAVADVHAEEAGERVEVAPAGGVLEVAAVTAHDDLKRLAVAIPPHLREMEPEMVERAHGARKIRETDHMLRAALLALLALAVAPAAMAAIPDIHAHRGGTVQNGTARFGEESIRAYRNAALHGFVLEVDAKLTEDGVPVAIHDATLDRTTNCSGEVRGFTLAELRSCRTDVLGSPGSPLSTRGARHTEAIATIAEVLEFARRSGAEVNLEIKNVPTDPDFDSTPAFANRVMDVVVASRVPRRQLLIQSFIAANLDVARQRLPGVATSLLAIQAINEPYLQTAADNDYDFISPEWPVGADYVRRAHAMGLDVAPFTLAAASEVRAARRARVDALITDDPLMAGQALDLRPLRRFAARAVISGVRLHAAGMLGLPIGVGRTDGCRGTVTMRVMTDQRVVRTSRGRVGPGCRFEFSTRRTPPRLGAPLVTIRFDGNSVLLPRLDGPERATLAPPRVAP
jgi:glycerophosphoryl diester phosphodiesterase